MLVIRGAYIQNFTTLNNKRFGRISCDLLGCKTIMSTTRRLPRVILISHYIVIFTNAKINAFALIVILHKYYSFHGLAFTSNLDMELRLCSASHPLSPSLFSLILNEQFPCWLTN